MTVNALEQFFVEHPQLMQLNLRPVFVLAVAIGALAMSFKVRFQGNGYAPMPLWAERCWRGSWLAGSPALMLDAYNRWQHPLVKSPPPMTGWLAVMQAIGLVMWVVLFMAGNFGILRAAFQHKPEIEPKV